MIDSLAKKGNMMKNNKLFVKAVYIVCAIIMGMISTTAFFMSHIFSLSTDSILADSFIECIFYVNRVVNGMQLLIIAAMVCTSIYYYIWLSSSFEKISASVMGLAFLFSGFTSLFASMIDVNKVRIPNLLLLFLHYWGYFLCYYTAILFLFNYLDGIKRINQTDRIYSLENKRLFYLVCFILTILWSPYIFMCFPGSIMYDTGTCFLYTVGFAKGSYANNPFFQNWISDIVYRFGEILGNISISIFIYDIIQVSVYIAVVLLKKKKVPSWILVSLVLLYGFSPFFPLYAFCMGKDSNFALGMLIFCVLIFEMISDGEQFFGNKYKIGLLALISLLLGLLRNQAYLIAIICLFFCSMLKDNLRFKRLLWSIIVVVLFVNLGLPRLCQIPKASTAQDISFFLQQTGYYVSRYGDEVTEEEKKAIEKVIPYEDLKLYNPGIVDPIKINFNNSADKSDIKDYFSTWWKQFKKHPSAYFKAFYYASYAYYCPLADRSDIRPFTLLGYEVDTIVFENTELKPNENPGLDIARYIDYFVRYIPIVGLFQRIGIYTWMLLITFVYLLSRKKYRYIICVCPLLFVFIGDCLSPVNGYFRYAFPMIMCVPVICSGVLFDKKK